MTNKEDIGIERFGKKISASTQQLVLDLYKKFKLERNGSSYGVIKKIHAETKVSERSIRRIVSRKEVYVSKKKKRNSLIKLNDEMKDIIRKKILELYRKNSAPSFRTIYKEIRSVPGLPYTSKTTLQKILEEIFKGNQVWR